MGKKSKGLPVSSAAVLAHKPSDADIDRERRYRAESDIRALKEADEIRRDKGRMKGCRDHAKQQMKLMGKI